MSAIVLIQDLDKSLSIDNRAGAVDLARFSGRPRRNRVYGRPRSVIRASAARLGWRGAHFHEVVHAHRRALIVRRQRPQHRQEHAKHLG